MKYLYDCHCHCKEGSFDGKSSIFDYVIVLKKKGFSGMIIIDHNSYNGYRYYKNNNKKSTDDFVVIRGIEYDTSSNGHILVIMPDDYNKKLIEIRGMKLDELINYVHNHGGVLGPAHPFQVPFLSIFKSGKYKNNYDILKQFDFIETYNIDDYPKDNAKALELAKEYNLPSLGGSDAHNCKHSGLGYTIFDSKIKSADDFIKYIKTKKNTEATGIYNVDSLRDKLGIFNNLLLIGYFFMNMFCNILNRRKINKLLAKDE